MGYRQSFTPNVVAGGKAIPLKPNLFYMKGRKHSQGGIDVGKSLEVEDGEVMQLTPKTIRVFSAEKFLGGRSPAEKVLAGEDINKTFKEQENYKDRNGLNDDGTRKKAKNGLSIDWEKYNSDTAYRSEIINKMSAEQKKNQTTTKSTTKSPIFEDNDSRIASSEQGYMDRVNKQVADKKRIDNGIKDAITFAAENTPYIENVMMFKDMYNDIKNKNYTGAVTTAGLATIPFVGSKINKYLKDITIIGRTLGLDPKSIYYNIAHRKELNNAINKAKDFYINDVTKRLDNKTANDLVNNPNNFKRIKFGYAHRSKGATLPEDILFLKHGDIIINPHSFENIEDIDKTIVHELRHRFDGDIKHNNKYTSIKSDTPDVDINASYNGKHAKHDYEKKANNTQARYQFYKKNKTNTDDYVKNTSDSDFYDTYKSASVDTDKAYDVTPRNRLINNLNNIPMSALAIGTAGTMLINKNRDKKDFGGIANIKNNTINTIRERLYNNVSPYGYHQPIKRLTQGVFLNKDTKDNDRIDRDDIWAEYLQIPKDKRRKVNSTKVVDSKYKPTKGNQDVKYKALTLTDDDKNNLIYHGNKEYKVNVGTTNRSGALGHYLGNHSISRGIDKNEGEYISYYDKWDIAPFKDKEDESLGIGKPIEFYDRLYLDDYYGVDKSNHEENAKTGYYGGYLQEITVNAKAKNKNKNKKAMGGITSIHPFTGGRKQSRIIARAGTSKDRELYNAIMTHNPGALPRHTFINENGDLVDDKGNIIQRNVRPKTKQSNVINTTKKPINLTEDTGYGPIYHKAIDLNIAYPKDTKKSREKSEDKYIGDIEQKPIELNIAYPRENNKATEQKVTFTTDTKQEIPKSTNTTSVASKPTTTTKPATTPAKSTTRPATSSTPKTTTKVTSTKAKSTNKPATKTVTYPKSTTPISSIPKLNPNVATREQAKTVNTHNYTIPQGIPRTGRTAPKTNPGKPNITRTRLTYDPSKDTNESITDTKKSNKLLDYIRNSKITDYVKNNPADFISAGSNMIGSLSSFLVNRSMINNMKAPSAPATKIAAKLNTNYNINPQLDEIRETTGANINTIRENTSSSATSINRINKTRNFGNSQVNKLYGEKENIQTQLINQDKLNQQEVANANIDAYNNYKDRLTDFYNRKSDLTSENRQALIAGLNSSVQDVISKKEQRNQDILSLALIHGSHPNTRAYIEAHYPTLYKKLKPFYQ